MFSSLLGQTVRSRFLLAVLIACICYSALPESASAAQASGSALRLGSAVQLVLARNPDLQVYRFKELGVQGLENTARLPPQLELNVEAENIGGTDDFKGVDGAEYTLALSSILELGGKRDARLAVASAQRQLIDSERQVRALDLVAEVTRRFVAVVANQARRDLAVDARLLAEDALKSVKRRAAAGAAPEAELVRARAQSVQADLAVSETQARLLISQVALCVLWGDEFPNFARVEGDLMNLGVVGDFNAVFGRAAQNPAIATFASEERLRKAEYQLATTQSKTDIGWSIGVRQFQDTNDTALVAGVSVPLSRAARSSGAVLSARAAREEVAVRRESAVLELRATLFDAFQQRKLGIENAEALRAKLIPALTTALQLTQRAYDNGRYGYQEWVAARQELISARLALISAAESVLQSAATIEQLTAQPLLPPLVADAYGPEQESVQ